MKVLAATSSAIFTPHKISSLSLWLDAADKSTITATEFNQVTEWRDKSANAFHVSASSTPIAPLTNTTTRNGLNVLSFDGANDVLSNFSNSLFRNVSGFGLFAVFQHLDADPSRIVHKSVATSANNRAGFVSRRASTKYEAIARRLDADAASLATSTADTDTNWKLLGQDVNFTTGINALRINGVQNATAATTTGTSENVDGGPLHIGSNAVSGQYMQGYIAEVVAYSKALSATELSLIENYLLKKWGI